MTRRAVVGSIEARRRASGRSRRAARGIALLALLTALVAVVSCSARKRPVNVVVIVLDTLRADRLGCYGYARETSPNLDRLASEGFLFENTVTASPWTAPSLISLMTSLYPAAHDVRDTPHPGLLAEGVTTLAEILRERGYETAAFTEGGYAKSDFGLGQGFELYPEEAIDAEAGHAIVGHPSRIVENVGRTVRWLGERTDRPFFLFFHTYEVHAPYRAPEAHVHRFLPGYDEQREHDAVRSVTERWNASREIDRDGALTVAMHRRRCAQQDDLPRFADPYAYSDRTAELGLAPEQLAHLPEMRERMNDLYDAGIRHADEQVERILAVLRERRMLDNTLVVFVSDHGEGLGEHGRLEHGEVLYGEVLLVPLILRVPEPLRRDLPRSGRVEPIVRTVDVLPTVLDLLAIPHDGLPMQGSSLLGLMKGGSEDRPGFSHARTVERPFDTEESVRMGPWRLILDTASGATLLYDLRSDPGALRDVSAQHPEVVERLRGLLDAQRARDAALRAELGGSTAPGVLDEATRRELRNLGYVGDD